MRPSIDIFEFWVGVSRNSLGLRLLFGSPPAWLVPVGAGASSALPCSQCCPPPGVRLHFHNLVKGLTDLSACKAQLGLGHSYSRAKVKFNVNRVDNMIIQSISLLDQLDKDINTFSMRVR